MNFVEMKLDYMSACHCSNDNVVSLFSALMGYVEAGRIKPDTYYTASSLKLVFNSSPYLHCLNGATLNACVLRGLLETDGKYMTGNLKGKKVYYISTKIYDYYLNVFKPSLDKYIEKYS